MAVKSVSVSASLTLEFETQVSGFDPRKQRSGVSLPADPIDPETLNQGLAKTYTIAASATQVVDFYSITNPNGDAASCVKLRSVLVTVSGESAKVKIEPDGTNPLAWPFSGTDPAITIDAPGGILLKNGANVTLSSTVRRWLLTNTGSGTATVKLIASLGT